MINNKIENPADLSHLDYDESATIEQKVNIELHGMQCKVVMIGAASNSLAALFFIWILYGHTKLSVLLGWYAVLLLVNTVNFISCAFYYKHRKDLDFVQFQFWRYIYYIVLAVLCIVLGLLGIISLFSSLNDPLIPIIFLLILLIGFSFGTISDFTASIISISCLITPYLLGQIWNINTLGFLHFQYNILGYIGVLLTLAIFLLWTCYVGYRLIKKSFRLGFINAALSARLENMNTALEQRVQELFAEVEQKTRDAAFSQIATQVAHDIRSPLATLNMVLCNLKPLQEDQRIMIRESTQRITDISNNLLTHYKIAKSTDTIKNKYIVTLELIAPLISSIISEKRVQYTGTAVSLSERIDNNCHGVFANIEPDKFKRALSNLINNAVEAIKTKGEVHVGLRKQGESLVISIIDNGCGISEDMLPKIIKRGISVGKSGGSGMGLTTAIHAIESWGGKVLIESKVDVGTTIEICLPEALPAAWFASQIFLFSNMRVVVLDDDESIHKIWQQRFSKNFSEGGETISLLHFYNPFELIEWYKNNSCSSVVFLMDYELVDFSLTGLDLIEQLDIANKALLVTSRYEDTEIRTHCEKLGVKIIPKSFSIHIPIVQSEVNLEVPDFIFIDDDEMLTKAWRNSGKLFGKKVLTFNCSRDFLVTIDHYPKSMLFYIDSDLGDGVKGENLAKILYEKGYHNLYLATGYDKDKFSHVSWIKGVVGKVFPH
jgi:signal transduction histidine kinase